MHFFFIWGEINIFWKIIEIVRYAKAGIILMCALTPTTKSHNLKFDYYFYDISLLNFIYLSYLNVHLVTQIFFYNLIKYFCRNINY